MKKFLTYLLCLSLIFLTSCGSSGGGSDNTSNSTPPSTISTFVKTYGGNSGDNLFKGLETDDGGFLLAGTTNSYGAGGADFLLIKTDSSGNVVWQKAFGGAQDEFLYKVINTSDGGYLVGGRTQSYSGSDLLLKLDKDGDILWQKSLTLSATQDLIETSSGTYLLTGSVVCEIDSSGNILWQKELGNSISKVVETSGGDFVGGGLIIVNSSSWDAWVVKFDNSGNILWQKQFGGGQEDSVTNIVEDGSGGYYISAGTNSFGIDGSAWLLRLKSDGTIDWQKIYGGSKGDGSNGLYRQSNGNLILSGSTQSFGQGDYDISMFEVDSQGGLLWQKTYGGTLGDEGKDLVKVSDGGFAIFGITSSFGEGGGDHWLLKVDNQGEFSTTVSGFAQDSQASESITTVSMSDTSFTPTNSSLVMNSVSVTVTTTTVVIHQQIP